MVNLTNICVIIPSLNPDTKLLVLIHELKAHEYQDIIIINDGSKPEADAIFSQAQNEGATVLSHVVNQGKGRALKTALNYVARVHADCAGVITADSDGQHSARDIRRLAAILAEGETPSLILGSRNFDVKDIPLKSRIGNKLTRRIFRFLSGVSISDTQTGLRAIPAALLKLMLAIPGERFEYEMNMLIECGNNNIAIKEIPIETIYLESNAGTHFNTMMDSLKIYATFLKYIASSLSASVLDFLIFFIAQGLGAGLDIATIISRAGSAAFNFTVNRNFVFKSRKNIHVTALKYMLLLVISGLFSYYILLFMSRYFTLLISKIIAETILFLFNYYFQKEKIFNRA